MLYAVFGILLTTHANAATYQIAPGDGIASYLKILRAGDTLSLRGGVYNEFLHIRGYSVPGLGTGGTSWSNPVTITSVPGERAIIRPSSGSHVLMVGPDTAQPSLQYIIIDGITFDGANVDSAIFSIGPEGGTSLVANHFRFSNNEFVNMPNGQGGLTSGNDIQFINNKFHESYVRTSPSTGGAGGGTACGQASCWGYPLYWSASNSLIEGNDIYHFPSFGIHMYCGNCTPTNNIVRNNTIHDFNLNYWPTPPSGAGGPVDPRGSGILIYSGNNHQVYGNNIYNGNIGIGVNPNIAPNVQVYGNNVSNMSNPSQYDTGGGSGSCPNIWDSSLAVPAGFGAAFNLFSSAKELLMNVFCSSNTAYINIGNGTAVQYIYKTGYTWTNNQWTSFNYSGSNMDSGGNWFIGRASASVNIADLTQKQSALAYICEWNGTSWKCGCNTSACTNNHWNLQQFKQ